MTAPPEKIVPGSIPRPCRHWNGRAGSCIRGDKCGSVMVNGASNLSRLHYFGLMNCNTRHHETNTSNYFSLLILTGTSTLQPLTNRGSAPQWSQSSQKQMTPASRLKAYLERNPKSPPRSDTQQLFTDAHMTTLVPFPFHSIHMYLYIHKYCSFRFNKRVCGCRIYAINIVGGHHDHDGNENPQRVDGEG